MKTPIRYYRSVFAEPDRLFVKLRDDLAWVRRDSTPRLEYYCNDFNLPYTYGSGRGVREYQPQPYTDTIAEIRAKVEEMAACSFETCFLNRYLNQKDHLGWHADDSPEMDDERPIAIVTFGVTREIWFRENGSETIEKLPLESGSVCLMLPGMQDTHQHRIPKAGFLCGERISLTFRGYNKK